jgi:predicted nuclease with TOPRIM domain
MTSKREVEEILKQSIETNNKLTKHIEALWQEIGEKQSKIYELNYEISELDEKKDSSKKEDLIERAQFQKDWLENYNHSKVDN